MGSISAAVITLNEGQKLESCLRSLDWVDEIVVVDGGSKDNTVEIASRYAKKIRQRPFDDFASQKNYAVDLAGGEWVLSIDADEIVSNELKQSILKIVRRGDGRNGFFIRRTNILFGRPLRFGAQASEKVLRLFKKGRGKFVQPIHEKLVVANPVGRVQGPLLHHSSGSVEEYLKKLKAYTDLEVRWMVQKRIHPTWIDFYVKPLIFFLHRYFIQRGFLDGYEGFLYHSLSSFYSFFKYVRLKEELG